MKLEIFKELVDQLRFISDRYDILNENGVDLLSYSDPYHKVIDILIKEIYGEVGNDWFGWFCYENDFGRKMLGAWDENKNPICQDVESLWEFLESKKETNGE